MATKDSRLHHDGVFGPGVRFMEHFFVDEYSGITAEALVSAGLVRDDQLPGRPGMPKSRITLYAGQLVSGGRSTERDEKFVQVTVSGKKFQVSLGVPKEVQAQRRAAWSAKLEAEREAARKARIAKAMAEGALYCMVNSADEYRQKIIASLNGVRCTSERDIRPNSNHGFSMDESVIEELNSLLSEMVELVSNADVRFDARRHQENILAFRSAVAKGDSTFQRTLHQMVK